jgi:hypothetical protein
MARSDTSYGAQVAALVLRIKERETILSGLQQQFDLLARNRLIIVERGLLALLQQLVEQAHSKLAALAEAKTKDEMDALIAGVREDLENPAWVELAEEQGELLAEKIREQDELTQSFQTRFGGWPNRMTQLKGALDEAKANKAPVLVEIEEYEKLKSLVEGVERGFRDSVYTEVPDLLNKLEASPANPAKGQNYLDAINECALNARRNLRQANLLLLMSPPDARKLIQYTVLLRTPSAPGTHGIYIEDKFPVENGDRQEILDAVKEIAAGVNSGLSRKIVIPQAPLNPSAAVLPTIQSLYETARETGDFMCRLFMSHELQSYLFGSKCSITLTTNDLELPLELMSYRDRQAPGEDKFLCLEHPVARMPIGRYLPRRHPDAREGRKLRFLLIYSDPENNLPGARAEVEIIHKELADKWQGKVEIDKITETQVTGRELNKYLRKGNYDVIHYAGHAFFDEKESDLSGLVLDGEVYFLAQKIHRLLEGRPLVFLNACQSATTANEQTQKKAEGLASAFIYGGAVGCVGSLWPVYDRPAAAFAFHFYDNVLKGHMIGEAMRLARRELKNDPNDQITWASYVLYGDPTFQLL